MKREFVADMKRLAKINKTIGELFEAAESAQERAEEAGSALDLCMDLLIQKWDMDADEDLVYDNMLFLSPDNEEEFMEGAKLIWDEFVQRKEDADADG